MNSTQLLEIGAKTLKINKVISYRLDSEIILSKILPRAGAIVIGRYFDASNLDPGLRFQRK